MASTGSPAAERGLKKGDLAGVPGGVDSRGGGMRRLAVADGVDVSPTDEHQCVDRVHHGGRGVVAVAHVARGKEHRPSPAAATDAT